MKRILLTILFIIISANTAQAALVDNVASYWKLDESSGDASDSVGSNNLTNTSTSYSAGRINNGATLTTSSDLTDLTVSGLPTGSSARTLNTWVKTTQTGLIFLMGQYSSGTTGNVFTLYMNDGKIYFSGAAADVAGNTTTFNDGNWHMCTITYDGTTIRMYIDANANNTGTPSLNTTANSPFRVGWQQYAGMLDEISMWSRALSASEITELYNSGNGKQYPFADIVQGWVQNIFFFE